MSTTTTTNDHDTPAQEIQRANATAFRDILAGAIVRATAAASPAAAKQPRSRRRKGRVRGKTGSSAAPGSGEVEGEGQDDIETAAEDRVAMRRGDGGVEIEAEPEPDPEPDESEENLAEFINYISADIFDALPPSMQSLHYSASAAPAQAESLLSRDHLLHLTSHLPPSVSDSLITYGIISEDSLHAFLSPPISAYVTASLTPPPSPSSTKASATACEICDRDWINLTYHHLIPRSTHAKCLKRQWHPEWRLNNVAWLCRACHSFVHRCASNEELAREWWTVEKLLGRDDVTAWKSWISRVRWKSH